MFQTFWAGIWSAVSVVVFIAPLNVKAEFYTFDENSSNYSQWQNPADFISEMAKSTTDLLNWTVHAQDRPVAPEKYDRLKHFGTWIDDSRTPECYDTRAVVLARDSEVQVKYSANNPCKVYSGSWLDLYSGRILKLARETEVDHVVALKNAYDSGAWNWENKQRCLYANFLGFPNHLLSVSVSENRMKGDRGPEKWMPSDSSFACQHLQNWLVIKYIWKLNMDADEALAIDSLITQHKCENKIFQFSKNEINRVRKFAQDNMELCKDQTYGLDQP